MKEALTADQNPYPPQAGTWTLTAPDGRQWKADSPLKCASAEQKDRIPARVQLQRIFTAADEWCEGAIMLNKDGPHYVVSVERDGKWIPVIRDASEFPSHIVEVLGINRCLKGGELMHG